MTLPRMSKKRAAAIADGTYKPKPRKAMKRAKMESKRKPTGEAAVFRAIWNERPHQCEVCEVEIHEPTASNFSHLLPKNAYPDLQLVKRNIRIKCDGCHKLWHKHGMTLEWSKGWQWICHLARSLKLEAHTKPLAR